SIRELFWYISIWFGFEKIEIKPFQNLRFWVKPAGFVTKLVYCYSPLKKFRKSFEFKTFDKISSLLNDGDVAVDVGANVGILTLFMSKLVGRKGKVYAIEASRKNIEILKQNLHLNNIKNITTIECAVSDTSGILYLHSPEEKYNDALLVVSKDRIVS